MEWSTHRNEKAKVNCWWSSEIVGGNQKAVQLKGKIKNKKIVLKPGNDSKV